MTVNWKTTSPDDLFVGMFIQFVEAELLEGILGAVDPARFALEKLMIAGSARDVGLGKAS